MGVLAQSISDAVRCAGGVVFDRAAAGWDVTVYPMDDAGLRAIQILGAKCGEPGSLFCKDASFPTVLVVTSSLPAANRRVEACVKAALSLHGVEVLFAGVDSPRGRARDDAGLYTLGHAAHAFKKSAAEAAGLQPDAVSRSEHFHTVAVPSRRSVTIEGIVS